MPNERVHKTLRIDQDIAQRVSALKEDGESETATYNRVLRAGLEAMDTAAQKPQEAPQEAEKAKGDQTPTGATEALTKALDALRDQLDVKDRQLEAKDDQLKTLSELLRQEQIATSQAQQLHALTEARAPQPQAAQDQQVTDEQEEPRGWWARHFRRR